MPYMQDYSERKDRFLKENIRFEGMLVGAVKPHSYKISTSTLSSMEKLSACKLHGER